jgi:hypothetical protein
VSLHRWNSRLARDYNLSKSPYRVIREARKFYVYDNETDEIFFGTDSWKLMKVMYFGVWLLKKLGRM